MNKALHCLVYGTVQGVCFRASTCEYASKLGLTGWVKNDERGHVELTAYGEEMQLYKLRLWLTQGPPRAEVHRISWRWVDYLDLEAFKIIRS